MGWTTLPAKYYKANGQVDRKAECDALYTWNDSETGGKCEVLKSSLVGSTWYGACKRTIPGKESYVFAGVCLTSVNNKDCYNFGYKDMDETVGPRQCQCPKAILDLLTPTKYEYAKEWRARCYKELERKRMAKHDPLKTAPIGTKIILHRDGEDILLEKGYIRNRKNPVWISWMLRKYWLAKNIHNYEFVKEN